MKIWTAGWVDNGERAAICHAHGWVWAFVCDLSKAGSYEGAWTLAATSGPRAERGIASTPRAEEIPNDLREWVYECQLGGLDV